MSKVLYIGEYRNQTQYGEAARNYIRALHRIGIDVVPRPLINFKRPLVTLDNELLKLESKNEKHCDIVIQHCRPEQLEYDGRFKKNIAIVGDVVQHIEPTFQTCLDRFDLAFTCSRNGFPQTYHLIDINNIPNEQTIKLPELEDKFVFCFAGQITKRKNITALLRAFHSAFSLEEPVELLIKTNLYGMLPEQSKAYVKEIFDKIKEGLGLYSHPNKYKQEVIITENLTEEGMWAFHNSYDCFVLPSYGENWNYHILKAFLLEKHIIVNKGLDNFNFTCNLVDFDEENVFGTHAAEEKLDGRNVWSAINVDSLKETMRKVYEERLPYPYRKDVIGRYDLEQMKYMLGNYLA